MGKLSRTKGHSFEREVAKKLRRLGLFPNAKRKLEYQEDECIGVDLENTGPFAIQCKRYKKYPPMNKIFEVDDGTKMPVLWCKEDRGPELVVLKADDFISLLFTIPEGETLE